MFGKISIRAKLIAVFGFVIAIFTFAAGFNFFMTQKMDNLSNTMERRYSDVEKALELKDYVGVLYGNQADLIINGDPAVIIEYRKNTKELERLIDIVTDHSDTDEEVRLSKEIKASVEKYGLLFDSVVAVYEKRGTIPLSELNVRYKQLDDETDRTRDEINSKADGFINSFRNEAEEARTGLKSAIARAVFISLLSLGVALVIGIFITLSLVRIITAPVRELLDSANAVAAGDLTRDIKISSGDEIGNLAKAFKKMVGDLRQLVGLIKERSVVLSHSAQQLNLNSQQTSAAANETAATMSEIATTVQEINASIKNISNSSRNAADNANNGSKGIMMITDQMCNIARATSESAAVIDGLGKKSREINQIIELITNIADQTNLLALNAAIEAARAGDQGRGFAVVAEEVRKLAEKSARAAKEIYNMIEAIQAESVKAQDSMAEGSKEVEAGNMVVRQVGQSFKEIIELVNDFTSQIGEVAAAADQVTSGVENVAAATEEQTASMEEVSASAATLTGICDDLKVLVGRFKI